MNPENRLAPHGSVVIAGAGQAGLQAAMSLRDAGHDGPIALVGDEDALPYQRPPLSKGFLLQHVAPHNLTLRSAAVLASRCISTHLGDPAVSVDPNRGEVVLDSGLRLRFDHLILAAGARPRPLPIPEQPGAANGVLPLRSVRDAETLRRALDDSSEIIVAGGGFIGMEVAAAVRALGRRVTVVEGLGRPMARAVSSEVSRHLMAVHRSHGVRFAMGRRISAVKLDRDTVVGVELDNGQRLAADLVVVGVGVQPNVELAESSGLPVANGVCVDARLLTNDTRISAIGDCAEYPSIHAGSRVRLESVQNAVDQARYVAARLTGAGGPRYQAVPWFWTYQYNQKVQIAGLGPADGRVVVNGNEADGSFSVYRFNPDGVLVCVESVNRTAEHVLARRILATARRPTYDQISCGSVDLNHFATLDDIHVQS